MAYIFLTNQDLNTQAFEVYLNKNGDADIAQVLEELEKQNIAIIKSKLAGRYDTSAIFSADEADRHYLIIKILVQLVVYDFIRRNAARKVPSDYVKEWEWAMKTLESIKAGKETPEGLPKPIDEAGNTVGRVISGSRKNSNYYI